MSTAFPCNQEAQVELVPMISAPQRHHCRLIARRLLRPAIIKSAALIISTTPLAVRATDLTCRLGPSKSECRLSCMSPSLSQTCDDPLNVCRSTCGLYDKN